MTSDEKDAEIARLREELQREREQHTETRRLLAAAINVWTTQQVPAAHLPWWLVFCAECQRSTSGRCALHSNMFYFYPMFDCSNVAAQPLPVSASFEITTSTH